MPTALTPAELERDLALRDLTDPAAGPHAIQLLVDGAGGALARAWSCPVRVERGPRAVPLVDNYDGLRYPPAAVTRDARYTRYVDDGHVLRSHATAMVPPALARHVADPADDVLLNCPGITYRRDAIDRLHTGTPHQLDLWRISRAPLGEPALEEMLQVLLGTLLPGREWRSEPRTHPYTLAGRQVDAAPVARTSPVTTGPPTSAAPCPPATPEGYVLGWKIQTPESRSDARMYVWPFGCLWTSTPQKLLPC